MKIIKNLIATVVVLGATTAQAQDMSEVAIEAYWNSPQVNVRVAKVKAAGFTHSKGETIAIIKHEFRGPYNVFERSYIVMQVFAPEKAAYFKATIVTAVVAVNALGEVVSTAVVDLPASGTNDFNEGSNEN